MKKLLVVLLALALPVAADGPVVCSAVGPVTTTWSESVESAAAGLACDRPADGGEEAEPSVYDDAVALWKLDEASGTRADSIGSLDLTDNNTVGSTSKGVGAPANLPGTVASFVAANNEYLNSAATPLVSTSTSEWTVAVWVNAASQDAVNTIWSFPGTNQHLLEQRSGAWSEWIGGSQVTVAGADTGAWHLLVGWYDGDKFYLQVDDGTPAESGGGVTADVYNNSAALRIGDRADFAGGFDWNGLLSVGTFWPRVLTSDERAALYNSGAGAVLP